MFRRLCGLTVVLGSCRASGEVSGLALMVGSGMILRRERVCRTYNGSQGVQGVRVKVQKVKKMLTLSSSSISSTSYFPVVAL